MKIRALESTDKTVWKTLLDEYAAFYKTSVPNHAQDTVWSWIFNETEEFWCDLIINDEGAAFGFTQYQLMHRSLAGSKVCYLSDLYVRPEQRNQGAGRALIDHVFSFARENNISNVRWLTQEFNYAGRKLYDTYASKSDFILYSVDT